MRTNIGVICLTLVLMCGFVTASFADGTISFKTAITKDPVLYSVDGTTAQLLPGTGPLAGQIPGYGPVFYEIFSAPIGTQLTLQNNGLPNFTDWTGTPVGPVNYLADGQINPPTTVILPGVAGQSLEVEVVAYTGSLSHPQFFGFSGMTFDGGDTVLVNTPGGPVTESTGALGWENSTGDPNGTPVPTPPSSLVSGSSGLGSLVLVDLPDAAQTLPLLGMAVIALGVLRRKIS